MLDAASADDSLRADTPSADLWDRLLGARREGRGGLRMMTAGGSVSFSTWEENFEEAARRSRVLRSIGVEPGCLVAGVLNNTRDAVVGLFATWFAGAGFASLPMRSRGMSRPEYLDQLGRIVTHCASPIVLGDDLGQVSLTRAGGDDISVHPWSSLDASIGGVGGVNPPATGAPVVVQYSSGSTGPPRGCILPSRAIAAQQEILAAITHINPGDDVVYTWVPLSHDMGLFGGLLLACYHDTELALSAPERFTMSPRTWFSDLANTEASITTGTSSALALSLRAHRGPLAKPLAIHSVFIGAEPVDWSVMQAALEMFAPSGLTPSSLKTAYGMAEITLVAACGPFGQPAKRLVLDREALEYHEIMIVPDDTPAKQAVSVTSQGYPCPGTVVTSERPGGIAELRIDSPSVADGYLGDADATAASFPDGIFQSRDLGFVFDDEVYVLGRTDDVYISAGRNVYLNDVETAVEDVVDARKGRVFLVEVRDPTPKLVALVELRAAPKNPEELAGVVQRTVMAHCGVSVAASLFVAKGQLPLTPSGKKQRSRCRQLLQRRAFDVVAGGGADAMQLL